MPGVTSHAHLRDLGRVSPFGADVRAPCSSRHPVPRTPAQAHTQPIPPPCPAAGSRVAMGTDPLRPRYRGTDTVYMVPGAGGRAKKPRCWLRRDTGSSTRPSCIVLCVREVETGEVTSPVESRRGESSRVESSQVESSRVESSRVEWSLAQSSPVQSSPVKSRSQAQCPSCRARL